MKQTRQGAEWLVVFFLVFWMDIDAVQAAPQLDASFGENGFVVKDFGSGQDEIFAMAAQADGKIVVVGRYDNGAVNNLAVARYLPTGELDRDFNDDGIFTASIGSGETEGRSVAIQSDGKIVAAGSTSGGENTMFLVRLTPEGFPDSTFGAGGQWLMPLADGPAKACAVRMTADGSIAVAGTVAKSGGTGTYGLVAKVTADGQPDAGFGEKGVARVRSEYDAEIRSLAIQDDGKIVAAGSFAPNGTAQAGMLRLNRNGSVDTQFGQDGRALLTVAGSGSILHDIAIDPNGLLYGVGEVKNGGMPASFVAGLAQDGSLEQNFANSGIYLSTLAAENAAQAITLDASGNLFVAGFVTTEKGKDIFLLTLQNVTATAAAAGSEAEPSAVKTVFTRDAAANSTPAGTGGVSADFLTADLANTTDIGNALVVLPGGIIFVAGATGMDDNRNFALLRFLTDDGKITDVTEAGSQAEGVSTAGYTIQTRQITSITRVGAMSGGVITNYGTQQCTDNCTASCSTNVDPTTCLATCQATCVLPTVTLRGVVFGIAAKPVYRAQGTTGTDTTTDTTNTTTDTTTDTTTTDTTTGSILQATTITDVNTFPVSDTFVYDLVETGQTEDGSGTGSYGSIIHGITPDTIYYVRAYALLSDGTVIYGNQQVFRTDDACFIATAAFGSLLDRHVAILREFRDRVMLPCRFGQRLVGVYYHISPPVADLIVKYEVLRSVVRVILIPLVFMAYVILNTGFAIKLCLLAAVIGLWPLKSRIS